MMRRVIDGIKLACGTLLLAGATMVGQQPATGLPALGSFAGGPFDVIDLANLNAHFTIPVFGRAGRGMPFSYASGYDSLVWMPISPSGTSQWSPVDSNWGWRDVSEALTGYVTYTDFDWAQSCQLGQFQYGKSTTTYYGLIYHDPSGALHNIPGTVSVVTISSSSCGTVGTTIYPITRAVVTDNSGYIVSTSSSSALGSVTVNARGGLTIITPGVGHSTGGGSVTDANGNAVSVDSSGNFTDTLDSGGSHVLQVTGTPSTTSYVRYTYSAPGSQGTGTPVYVQANYTTYTVQTCFGASMNGASIAEFPPTTESLIWQIRLPDGTAYSFGYEPTVATSTCTPQAGAVTGRIASVTLPTGGMISYSYSGTGCGNGSNCMMADGSPSSMARELTGGTPIIDQPGTWTYTRAVQSGLQLPQTTTTINDPAGNLTTLLFSGIFETDSKVYTGSSSLLDHSYICYVSGESHSSCSAATVQTNQPITFRGLIDYPSGGSVNSELDTSYDGTYGFVTGSKAWNFGNGSTPQQQTSITYNTSLCTSKNICDHPSTVQITGAALTNYSYDGNGNTQEVSRWTWGSNYLNSYYYYNGNGTLSYSLDVNGTRTNYNYGSGSCNSAFPTSTTVLGLTTSYQYNCIGGILTAITDPNNATTTTAYSDPHFWRPASTTDPLQNKTSFTYYSNAYTSGYPGVESVLTNSASGTVVDNLTVLDAYGRISLAQTRDPGLGTWDTVEYLYDGNGRSNYVTLPFADSPGVPEGNKPSTGYFYDTLNRYTEISTSNGQSQLSYTNFYYNENDVQVTVNPPSAGSSYPTSRQYEYDALGDLTSVCELSPSGGGAACGQNNNPGTNGYATSYVYDPLSDLVGVTQGSNQSSYETRSFTYDHIGRLSQETNPETSSTGNGGSTTYAYDGDASGKCSGTYNGDLVNRTDPAGNVSCYQYDGIHRVTKISYPSGPNSGNTQTKVYYYDGPGPYWGITPANPKGRLAAAGTYVGSNTYTAEVFNYDLRGEATDLYESTPNSGWYHTQQGYAANGAIGSLRGFNGTGTTSPFSDLFTYSLDGEGRIYSILDTTTGAPVLASTTYNTASQPTIVGSESFQYDPNSGRMMQWISSFNGNTQTGAPAWNANGTLKSLQINDNANIQNNGNCTYTYDDLARLASDLCDYGWGQAFGYDLFGNITKTVPPAYTGVSFTLGYGSGNHVNGFSYDGMGNVTLDNLGNAYTYDAEGRPASAAGVPIYFDAFGRAVAEEKGGVWTQIVYAPSGWKFALMNGTSLIKYRDPMPGGLVATHNGDGSGYYQHADWLGSSRMGDQGEPQARYDRAYAPFGEVYGELNGNMENRTFTGPQEDTTQGIDDFLLRQYSASQGRWLTPDPAGSAAVDITNPQTWNRYAYLSNNPLNATDPLGLYCAVDANTGGPFKSCNPGNDPYFGGGVWDWGYGIGAGGSVISTGVSGNPCGSDFFPCGLPIPSPWPGLLGLPSDLDCPQGLSFLCGGISPIMDVTDPRLSWAALNTCTQQLYGVTVKNFVPVSPGSNGYFFGINKYGSTIEIETDPTHSKVGLAVRGLSFQLLGGLTHGYNPYYNYVASDLAESDADFPLPPTQIHELGHSLEIITTGASDELDKLWNCVMPNIK